MGWKTQVKRMTASLYQHSLALLADNQNDSGAFPASTNFPAYQYSWFRDGSFISHALDLAGCAGRAGRFHRWCAKTVLRYRNKIEACITSSEDHQVFPGDLYFHCRFTAGGEEVPGHWGNHQLDGLGTWLWSLHQNLAFSHTLLDQNIVQAIDLAAHYLRALWRFPCSDCWEENETGIHTHTLAAIYAGLIAHWKMRSNTESCQTALAIKDFILEKMAPRGYLTKSLNDPEVDASLLGAAVPYHLVELSSPIFQETLARIEKDLLSPEGGMHRYRKDTYYGGGEWLLLSAWYGWIKLQMGDVVTAQRISAWIENQADSRGNLPEQVNHYLNNPASYQEWVHRWGTVASPLLWSHGMYVILTNSIF
jgi:GH15 family glucan-1,4-alpha-glucosidase